MDLLLAAAVDADNPVEGDLWLSETGDARATETLEEEVVQQLAIRLRFFLGEWFLDGREGIPFYRDVFKKNPSLPLLRALYRRVIATTPGVDSVRAIELEVDAARVARLGFEAVLSDGAVLTFEDFLPFVVSQE